VHNPWAPSDAEASAPAKPTRHAAEITAPPVTGSTPVVAANAAQAPSLDEDDEDGATVVVDRRPVITWSLVVEDGPTLRISEDHVLLGRKPASTASDTQALAIPDTTRTLSKVHARLDLDDGTWFITDLNSTNGVLLRADDGTETEVESGVRVAVTGTFVLGKVAMSLTHEA